MSDFIREVDEDYRRDRIIQTLAKYQVHLVVLAVAIIAGAGGYRYYVDHTRSVAEAANSRYEAALQLTRDNKPAEAETAFQAMTHDVPAGYVTLARMKAAEVAAKSDPAAGIKAFDAIADDNELDPTFRDLARLRAAYLRVDRDDPKVFEQHYTPYAGENYPYHASLRELLALAALKRGDNEAAGRWLDQIVIDPKVPSGLRSRAEGFLSLVASGGASKSAAAPSVPPAPASPAPAATTPAPPSPAPAPSVPATPAPTETPAK